MPKAVGDAFTQQVMKTCVGRHLDPLPASVETVVLLGTAGAYVKGVKALMREQFGDYHEINEMAFAAQGRTWAFATHPSPANGEFKHWLAGDPGATSGRKQRLAVQALGTSPAVKLVVAPAAAAVPGPAAVPAATPRQQSISVAKPSGDRFAQTFHLVRDDGRRIVPVRMRNLDTGVVAFRVAEMGNTKDSMREIVDEAELLRLCESGQYQVRAQPLDKSSPPSLVRPLLRHRIVKGTASDGSSATD